MPKTVARLHGPSPAFTPLSRHPTRIQPPRFQKTTIALLKQANATRESMLCDCHKTGTSATGAPAHASGSSAQSSGPSSSSASSNNVTSPAGHSAASSTASSNTHATGSAASGAKTTPAPGGSTTAGSSSQSHGSSASGSGQLNPVGYAAVPNVQGAPSAFTTNPNQMHSAGQQSGTSAPKQVQPGVSFAQAGTLLSALNNSTGGFIPHLLNRLNSTHIPCDKNNSTNPFPPLGSLASQIPSLLRPSSPHSPSTSPSTAGKSSQSGPTPAPKPSGGDLTTKPQPTTTHKSS